METASAGCSAPTRPHGGAATLMIKLSSRSALQSESIKNNPQRAELFFFPSGQLILQQESTVKMSGFCFKTESEGSFYFKYLNDVPIKECI